MVYCLNILIHSFIYRYKLEEEPVRVLRRNIIHSPAECNLLFQLIKLLNILKIDPNDQIRKK